MGIFTRSALSQGGATLHFDLRNSRLWSCVLILPQEWQPAKYLLDLSYLFSVLDCASMW